MQAGRILRLASAALAAAVLASCGGGGGTEPPRTSITRMVVAGDSLVDVGATGIKQTVQNSADPAGFPVYPQLVAADFGITSQCNFFTDTGGVITTNAGCTNFAVEGGRIVYPNPANPRSLPLELSTAVQAVGGAYTATDLVLVEDGGNDSADLVKAYLAAGRGNVAAYQAFLAQQLPPATIASVLPQPNGAATLAGMYMTALADTYYNTIKANVLDKGATHVVVLNIPDITITPEMQQVFTAVTSSSGAAAAAQLQGAIRQWVGAFNTELKTRVGGDTRVVLLDFYQENTDEVANPAASGITNLTDPVCPATGIDPATGLPTYDFHVCTSAALDAAPPAGKGPGWWQTYAFSDSFHPTPFQHRLIAAAVARAIARAGWL